MSKKTEETSLFSLIKHDWLSREIVALLLLKLMLIILLWALFFNVPDDQVLTSKDIDHQILGSQSVSYPSKTQVKL